MQLLGGRGQGGGSQSGGRPAQRQGGRPQYNQSDAPEYVDEMSSPEMSGGGGGGHGGGDDIPF
jgi:single-strand DNA-binding protein